MEAMHMGDVLIAISIASNPHDPDYLVVMLGADYDIAATPGLEAENEFYSVAGARRLRDVLLTFERGHALVGVCGARTSARRRRANAP